MIHISTMTGKLEGIPAINTDTTSNPFCKQMSKGTTVCGICYSDRMLKTYRKNCAAVFQRNDKALSEELLTDNQLPRINAAWLRIHAHGELINHTHWINLIRIAEANPQTTFAIWTKRTIVRQGKKPDNMILIFSNPILDTVIEVPKGFHKVFNVVSKGSKIPQNCTGQKCIDCLACYNKKSGTDVIVEQAK